MANFVSKFPSYFHHHGNMSHNLCCETVQMARQPKWERPGDAVFATVVD